jgi:lincosamide nucleotidyltransferase A/C/D/E
VGDRRDFTVADVAEVLERLEEAGVEYWLDGGWGVDALLGVQTRKHDDVDIVVDQEDVARGQEALSGIGFAHAGDSEPGLPSRVVLVDRRGRQVDFHPVVVDHARNGWQPLGDGAWGQYPAEGLAGSGEVGEKRVACITPALQLRHHLGYPWGEQDRQDMEALGKRFGLALPPGAEPSSEG